MLYSNMTIEQQLSSQYEKAPIVSSPSPSTPSIKKDTLQIPKPKRKRRQKKQARLFMTVLCNDHQIQRKPKFTLK